MPPKKNSNSPQLAESLANFPNSMLSQIISASTHESPVELGAILKPKVIPNVDLSGKRNNHVNDPVKNGRSFLNPGKNIEKKKTFFRADPAVLESYKQAKAALLSYQTGQLMWIAQQLNLNPPSPENLMKYISTISAIDVDAMNTIKSIIFAAQSGKLSENSSSSGILFNPGFSSAKNDISNINRTPFIHSKKPQPISVLGPITSYDHHDVRYTHCQNEDFFMKEPILLGISKIDLEIPIKFYSEEHVIIQCYMAGVVPSPISWPPSLKILINGFVIKSPGNYSFSKLDVSKYLPTMSIRICCSNEISQYSLIVRPSKYFSYKEVVEKIMKNHLQKEEINNEMISIFCPLSGDIMKYPGKGIKCNHFQCFDLKEYIKRSNKYRKWICPICNRSTELSDLVFSETTYVYISSIGKSALFNSINQQNVSNLFSYKNEEHDEILYN